LLDITFGFLDQNSVHRNGGSHGNENCNKKQPCFAGQADDFVWFLFLEADESEQKD
jgi:hypothetical protein